MYRTKLPSVFEAFLKASKREVVCLKEHVIKGTFPIEKDLRNELKQFYNILIKYNVEVLRPNSIEKLNQIFARDIAFVIDDKIIISNTIEDRKREVNGINYILKSIHSESILKLSDNCRIEGGDVIVHDDYIFIGYSRMHNLIIYFLKVDEFACEQGCNILYLEK